MRATTLNVTYPITEITMQNAIVTTWKTAFQLIMLSDGTFGRWNIGAEDDVRYCATCDERWRTELGTAEIVLDSASRNVVGLGKTNSFDELNNHQSTRRARLFVANIGT